jgi:hypothetical protein
MPEMAGNIHFQDSLNALRDYLQATLEMFILAGNGSKEADNAAILIQPAVTMAAILSQAHADTILGNRGGV